MEWCFVVATASGPGEVRVRDNGEVVHTAGSVDWISLDGISFPGAGAVIPVVKRNDLLRIDGIHEHSPPINNRIVAHYTTPRTAIDFILKDGSLKLSRYRDTKDPRESKDWLFAVRCAGATPAAGEAIEISSSLSRMLKDSARLLCFASDTSVQSAIRLNTGDSDSSTRPRMWEQYAATHSGVALLFDRSRLI